jgi:hypothetical protein
MKCKIVNRRLDGKFLATGAVDGTLLDRIEHDKMLRARKAERIAQAKAKREAMNAWPLSHNPFAALKGGK